MKLLTCCVASLFLAVPLLAQRTVPFTRNAHGTPGAWSLTTGGGSAPQSIVQGQGAAASVSVEWTSNGLPVRVTVVQGSDELPSAFANRAKVTVAEMKAAFPPDAGGAQ